MKTSELAERIGATCEGGDVEVNGVASFAAATAHSLVFVEHPRFLQAACNSLAGAMIVPADAASETTDNAAPAPSRKVLLRSVHPRLAFARAAEELRHQQSSHLPAAVDPSHPAPQNIHPSAIVDPAAHVHPTASVEALAVIGAAAEVGARCHIGPGTVVGPGVVIGEDCHLEARVVVYPATTIGDRVIVQAGAVLGSDGFGFVPDPATGRYHKFPQIGRLEIGNDVEIGANTTIDRGALDATIISDGVKLDNLVQIGHNVHLGRNVVVASQTGISGSTVLEDNVIVGGQVGIADHVRIEQGVILGAQCGIPSKKVLRGKGILFWGTPARPIAQYLKELATLARLTRKK
jgi:UDP-3-O-[3-hydroxymyristoyl] glucosamine N-acyltransferase